MFHADIIYLKYSKNPGVAAAASFCQGKHCSGKPVTSCSSSSLGDSQTSLGKGQRLMWSGDRDHTAQTQVSHGFPCVAMESVFVFQFSRPLLRGKDVGIWCPCSLGEGDIRDVAQLAIDGRAASGFGPMSETRGTIRGRLQERWCPRPQCL